MESKSQGPLAGLGGSETAASYQVLGRLAVGGMAELYLARHAGRVVVLKRILPHLAEDPEFVRMFHDEANLAATLDHPNIVRVHEQGRAGDELFFTMEYVHGENARTMIRAAQQVESFIPLAHIVQIGVGIATGLHYAHERRDDQTNAPLEIVHRDVSPTNVLIAFDGAVKIVDFGIAKAAAATHITQAGMLKGKASYMSPEQCRAEPVDRRSDVFAIGILLYELTTLTRLFRGDNELAVMHQVLTGRVDPPSERVPGFPPGLEGILLKALQPVPAERYQTAAELGEALGEWGHVMGLSPSRAGLGAYLGQLCGTKPLPWDGDPAVEDLTHAEGGAARAFAQQTRVARSGSLASPAGGAPTRIPTLGPGARRVDRPVAEPTSGSTSTRPTPSKSGPVRVNDSTPVGRPRPITQPSPTVPAAGAVHPDAGPADAAPDSPSGPRTRRGPAMRFTPPPRPHHPGPPGPPGPQRGLTSVPAAASRNGQRNRGIRHAGPAVASPASTTVPGRNSPGELGLGPPRGEESGQSDRPRTVPSPPPRTAPTPPTSSRPTVTAGGGPTPAAASAVAVPADATPGPGSEVITAPTVVRQPQPRVRSNGHPTATQRGATEFAILPPSLADRRPHTADASKASTSDTNHTVFEAPAGVATEARPAKLDKTQLMDAPSASEVLAYAAMAPDMDDEAETLAFDTRPGGWKPPASDEEPRALPGATSKMQPQPAPVLVPSALPAAGSRRVVGVLAGVLLLAAIGAAAVLLWPGRSSTSSRHRASNAEDGPRDVKTAAGNPARVGATGTGGPALDPGGPPTAGQPAAATAGGTGGTPAATTVAEPAGGDADGQDDLLIDSGDEDEIEDNAAGDGGPSAPATEPTTPPTTHRGAGTKPGGKSRDKPGSKRGDQPGSKPGHKPRVKPPPGLPGINPGRPIPP